MNEDLFGGFGGCCFSFEFFFDFFFFFKFMMPSASWIVYDLTDPSIVKKQPTDKS